MSMPIDAVTPSFVPKVEKAEDPYCYSRVYMEHGEGSTLVYNQRMIGEDGAYMLACLEAKKLRIAARVERYANGEG